MGKDLCVLSKGHWFELEQHRRSDATNPEDANIVLREESLGKSRGNKVRE